MIDNNIGIRPGLLRLFTSSYLVLLFITPCLSQTKVYFQHMEKTNRQKKISLNKEYSFQTRNTTLFRHRIASFSYDTLVLSSKHSHELVKICINDIDRLEMEKKYGAFDIIGTIGLITLSITPIIWATEGSEEALGMLEVSGVFLACSVPFLAFKEIGRKKNTKTKWKICTG